MQTISDSFETYGDVEICFDLQLQNDDFVSSGLLG